MAPILRPYSAMLLPGSSMVLSSPCPPSGVKDRRYHRSANRGVKPEPDGVPSGGVPAFFTHSPADQPRSLRKIFSSVSIKLPLVFIFTTKP